MLRRFDIDGDAKINLKEFQNGIKYIGAGQPRQRSCEPRPKSIERPKSSVKTGPNSTYFANIPVKQVTVS